MKICAINGSLRGGRGVSGRLLDSLGEGVTRAGGSFQVVHLAKLHIEGCLACDRCQRGQGCVHDGKDDAQAVFAHLREADLVVWATPVYVLGPSSLLRRLLERVYALAPVQDLRLTRSGLFFHAIDEGVLGKPFVSVVVCDNMEDETVRGARDTLAILGRFCDAPRVGHLERRSAARWRAALEGQDAGERHRAEEVRAAWVRAGEELVTSGRVSRATRRRAQAPFVHIPWWVRLARHVPWLRPGMDRQIRARTPGSP